MARYTCSFYLSIVFDQLQPLLVDMLQQSNLNVMYCAPTFDYIMAREIPGTVPFSKLVTVEILIDKSTATETETRMSIVMKNEELPLQIENHCRQVYEYIKEAIEYSRHWHLIETIAG